MTRRIVGGRRIWLQLALTAAFIGVLAWLSNTGIALSTFSRVGYG